MLLQIRWDRVFRTPHLASAFPGWETPLAFSTISYADRSILVRLFRKERFSYTLALLKRTVGHLECPPLGRTFKDPIAEQGNAISYAVRCTLVRQSLLQISLLNCFPLAVGPLEPLPPERRSKLKSLKEYDFSASITNYAVRSVFDTTTLTSVCSAPDPYSRAGVRVGGVVGLLCDGFSALPHLQVRSGVGST